MSCNVQENFCQRQTMNLNEIKNEPEQMATKASALSRAI